MERNEPKNSRKVCNNFPQNRYSGFSILLVNERDQAVIKKGIFVGISKFEESRRTNSIVRVRTRTCAKFFKKPLDNYSMGQDQFFKLIPKTC